MSSLYGRLSWTTKFFNDANARAGSEGNNIKKNRITEIIPNDVHRVVLKQAIYENNSGSDYINATYVNGYSKLNAFIATQHPLPETIDDFWLMIQQTEVSMAVLLSNTIHGSMDLPIFWPPLHTAREYGGVLVNHQSEESNGGSIERMFTVRNVDRLSWTTKFFNDANARAGGEGNNITKNRITEIIPNDVHRVVLKQAIYENNSGSDYINATYVNGYSKLNAFIATQHPLPETIDDFWLMIQQTEVSMAVLLSNTIHGSMDLPIFWPPLHTAREYGGVLVNHQSEESNGGSIERMFTVRNVDSAEKWRNLTMLQFEGWTDHGVPKDLDKFISLLNKVETHKQNQSDDRPVVIICRDGAGRSGTFIAISLILERFKAEQVIDVFEAIKLIRGFRPEFVDNAVQYRFCYTAALAVVDSYGTYEKMYE
ncbi:receptor-type tyrosine-protein phosphatase alpha-like [Rhopilema esculentum]|uniref:receptor-type tyrosine-protein phosphatase alpha-like n=1 Tax=Rhopilema esculentum TaxID=499914 RepID=UPI0031DEE6BB